VALALYRKYRPATFSEVVGQEHVTEPLMHALASGRINHAYLFSGPRGCGKTSSARILARSLNCETRGPTPDPCGKCDSGVALAPDCPGSLDVIEIDAASHGGVDDARDLRERARIRALEVLPQPRGPENRYAWLIRPLASACISGSVTCSWPTTSEKVAGRYFQ